MQGRLRGAAVDLGERVLQQLDGGQDLGGNSSLDRLVGPAAPLLPLEHSFLHSFIHSFIQFLSNSITALSFILMLHGALKIQLCPPLSVL